MPAPAAAFAFDAFDALPDPAAILAADGAMVRANAAFRATFRQWIGPQRPPWGRVTPPPFKDGERRFGAPAPDGRRFEWTERVLPDGARLAVAHDVTRLVQAAEEAGRAKTVLFATLTHELRTPLNGILGMAGLLAEAKLEPAGKSYLAAIQQSGEHLLDLISEILDYSRLEAGRVALEAAPFDPETTMQEVAELLSPKAFAKGLEIAVKVRAGAPAIVTGDDGRLRQILFNLAGNAVKFTEAGGVVLEMAPLGQDRLRFTVRDSGPGIAPEKQALIFEEFAQADAGVARRHGGAGLGLAIVQKLAKAMGGEVGLFSAVGQGSRFWVDLPLSTAPGDAGLPTLQNVRLAVKAASQHLNDAIHANVASLGGEIVSPDQHPDVVLLDWREDYGASHVAAHKGAARALIALIPQEQRDWIARAREAGVDQYTLKPLRRRSLAERVRVALGGSAPTTLAAQQEAEGEAPQCLKGMRVLLAEDNPINALLARTLLSRVGCIVNVVGDGEEAVTAAATAPYDLIFLDLRMPRLDGVGAAERIRQLPGPAGQTPLVALTADAAEEDRVRALKAGMDDFVTKPIDSARLIAVAAGFTARAKPATL